MSTPWSDRLLDQDGLLDGRTGTGGGYTQPFALRLLLAPTAITATTYLRRRALHQMAIPASLRWM
jgi:hypothetical protein